MNQQIVTYEPGGNNPYRNERYRYLSRLNQEKDSLKYAKTKYGNQYYHIISFDENNPYNLLGEKRILDAVNDRFKSKAGDKTRVLTNMLSSQACCFNLFAPLWFKENKDLCHSLFSHLLGEPVRVTDMRIEYTPTLKESIGDQAKNRGTDADLGVFYETEKGKKGVILAEFKYIEDKFSLCTSYKNKNGRKTEGKTLEDIRPICDNENFLGVHEATINGKPGCGYLKYQNWDLTRKSSVFDFEKIKEQAHCPFRYSLNQLWRNFLLAEKVAKVRGLDTFHFWVIAPKQNTILWNNHSEDVYEDFHSILSSKGQKAFRKIYIETDIVSFLESGVKSDWNRSWIRKFRTKYLDK